MTTARTESIAGYRTAIKLKPTDAEAHNNLAAALEDDGQLAAAIASARR